MSESGSKADIMRESSHGMLYRSDGKHHKVMDMSEGDRPREKALKYGISSLTDAELWAIILRVGTQGYPITTICRDLMRSCNESLRRLYQMEEAVLMMVEGIGPAKMLQVKAVMELGIRFAKEQPGKTRQIRSSEDIYEEFKYDVANKDHEEIWILYLNQSNKVIGREMITSGSAVASVFDQKSVVKRALMRNAQGLVMVHNHPSGNVAPSPQDDMITRRLAEGCKYLDLRMLDHLIVTTNGYYSYNDHGRL